MNSKTTNPKLTPQQIIDQIKETWPHPLVPRNKVAEATGYLVTSKTLANEDSKGTGPEGALMVNGHVCYPTQSLVDWLKKRAERRQRNSHERG